jgi:MoxR-like ATPase
MVIATQNPIELEGTYPLPEAQLDRFLMRLPMGYPGRDAEAAILEAQGEPTASVDSLTPVATALDVAEAASLVPTVHVAPEVRDYVLDIVAASRRHPDLVLGASPRGSLSLQRAARALAASFGRSYVLPDDVKRVAPSVLEHRLLVAPDAQLRGVTADDVVRGILASVAVPGATGG